MVHREELDDARDGTRTRSFPIRQIGDSPFVFAGKMTVAGLEPATHSTRTSTRFLAPRAPPVIGVTPESSASAIYSWVLLTLPGFTGLGRYPLVPKLTSALPSELHRQKW